MYIKILSDSYFQLIIYQEYVKWFIDILFIIFAQSYEVDYNLFEKNPLNAYIAQSTVLDTRIQV